MEKAKAEKAEANKKQEGTYGVNQEEVEENKKFYDELKEKAD